ncbi:hypothetical protein [Sphingosinicella terrae]|uniref:hypothetical protein n=1 Tax=Sphingosinicella terrae TaxID=2172047 RepID=UPI000E0CDAFE|nr:hypothetical protein [Sphingosinicella terrae]
MQWTNFIPLVSGLVGAIIGALANAFLRDRSDRRTAREALVGEIARHASEILAALLEFFRARQIDGAGLEKWSALAALERALGQGTALEIRIFREFRARRVRTAYHRLLNRSEILKDALSSEQALSEKRFKTGTRWVEEQISESVRVASAAAGIDLVDRARLIFVGWRKVTLKDRQALSYDPDPLPWEYALALQFADPLPQDAVETIHRRSRDRIGDMVCAIHDRAPHVVLSGQSSNFRVEIDACCALFAEEVNLRFMGLGHAERGAPTP